VEEECPEGCIVEEYKEEEKKLGKKKRDIMSNISTVDNNTINRLSCVFDECSLHSNDSCISFTESICIPTSNGCQFVFILFFF
jgi:hypothetical protein